MRISRKRWAVEFLIAAVVIAAGLFALHRWVSKGLMMRKFLKNPAVSLTRSEFRYISKYLRESPATEIRSAGEEDRIVKAAIERTRAGRGATMLAYVARRWRTDGLFPNLPRMAGEAIRPGVANADDILIAVLADGSPTMLDGSLDVDRLFLRGDSLLVLAGLLMLRTHTLAAHKGACLQMLAREDLAPGCKLRLLELVAQEKAEAEWFGAALPLLRSLRRTDDEQLRGSAERMLARMSHRVSTSSGGNDEKKQEREGARDHVPP